MTQEEKVVEYMRKHGGITTREAMIELGVARLASRIYDLTRRGVKIHRESVTVDTRDGKTKVTRYSLEA